MALFSGYLNGNPTSTRIVQKFSADSSVLIEIVHATRLKNQIALTRMKSKPTYRLDTVEKI